MITEQEIFEAFSTNHCHKISMIINSLVQTAKAHEERIVELEAAIEKICG